MCTVEGAESALLAGVSALALASGAAAACSAREARKMTLDAKGIFRVVRLEDSGS